MNHTTMATIKKVLVPFDNNLGSIAALDYAAMFASGIGATITALHLADPKNFHSLTQFKNELVDLVNDELRPKLKEIQKTYPDIRKIDLQIRGLEKSIHRHILNFATEHEIDFIILRSHGLPDEKDWEGHFKNTIAYKVVLEALCPVFTFIKNPESLGIRNILVPLDLSEGSLYKLPIAINLSIQFGATVHLISTSEDDNEFDELNQQLDEMEDELKKIGSVANHRVFKGTLTEAINSYVGKLHIDLVMVMSRPGFRWSDLWISPRVKQLISHSKVPVVSIRSNKPVDI